MFYNRPKVNFQEKELFSYKFKREPKSWTLEEVQDLWERASKRGKKRQSMISKVYDKIINEIHKDERGKKTVYYTENDKVYNYEFSYTSEFKSWGYSTRGVEFSKDKSKARDEKIEFILSNDRAFELGKEFRDIKKMGTRLEYRVKQIFVDEIENKLKKIYKDKFPPDITVVKVGDKKYYFAVDDQHRFSYLKFHFKGEVKDNTIEL